MLFLSTACSRNWTVRSPRIFMTEEQLWFYGHFQTQSQLSIYTTNVRKEKSWLSNRLSMCNQQNRIAERKQTRMPTCPKCGKLNADDAIYCTGCGASLGNTSQPAVSKPIQSEAPISSSPLPATSSGIPSSGSARELSQRLEKALRRAEVLSYAAIGLSVLVLVLLLYLSFA
jgi:hypothetical protein